MANAHQCWPPMVTNVINTKSRCNVQKRSNNKQCRKYQQYWTQKWKLISRQVTACIGTQNLAFGIAVTLAFWRRI